MSEATARRERLVGAVLLCALVAVAFYGLDRSRAAIAGQHYDPHTLIASLRVDYFWRVGLSAFIGSLAGGLWWVAIPDPARGLQLLLRATPWVGAIAAVLSVVWP